MIAKAARWLSVGAIALLVATGCTRVVDGEAARAPGGPAPGAVDPALLVPGNYPTKPQGALGTAGSPEQGARVEAARMASAVVGPWEIDPKLSEGVLPTGVFTSARQLKAVTSGADAAGQHQFVTSFFSTRRNKDNTLSMVSGLLRFPDPAAAAQAATDMHAATLAPPADEYGIQRVAMPVPDHPESLATGSTSKNSFGDARTSGDVEVLTARGPFILYEWAKTLDGPDAAMGMAKNALDKQIPRVDGFSPTEVGALSELAIDPTGLLAKTIPGSSDTGSPGLPTNLTFDRAGALHFQSDPTGSSSLFDKAGMDVWATGKTGVYETRDAQAAADVANAFAQEMRTGGSEEAAVPNLNGSQCSKKQQLTVVLFSCFSTADKYVIEATAPQLVDAQQQSAAQYLMLTAQ